MASDGVERGHRLPHPLSGHALAEEHDVGLEQPAAGVAGRHIERIESDAVEIGIAVRRARGIEGGERGIPPHQLELHGSRGSASVTVHAAHGVDATVQIDHVAAASRLVQAVHVLGDELRDAPLTLEARQRAMRVVRVRRAHARPADETPRPIASRDRARWPGNPAA